MLDCSKQLLETLSVEYKRTGLNEFNMESYLSIQNHDEAIEELKSLGILHEKNNILQTLSFSHEFLNR